MIATSAPNFGLTADTFPGQTDGLPTAILPRVVRVHGGDRVALRIAPVVKRIGANTVRMIAYNGSIPGPILHVDQGAEITVDVTNDGDLATTVHWHGVRLANEFDGVPYDTQAPIEIGQTFTYRVRFPDPGMYWYHPHLREDYGQEMGMYGVIIVEATAPDYWPVVDRQMVVTLDDLLVEDGSIAPFRRSGPNYTAMGRYGNIFLINGRERLTEPAAMGEIIRLMLVNTANTRNFNIAIPGARMKLVGGDSGRYERETFVDEVLLAPSERAIVDVRFERTGLVRFEHRTPDRTYDLGAFDVAAPSTVFDELRTDADLVAIRAALGHDRDRDADKMLAFVGAMPSLHGEDDQASSTYARPMHPMVTGSSVSAGAGDGHATHLVGDGLKWEDPMPEMNRRSDPSNMSWCLVDRATGAENGSISWSFVVGDRVKIQLVNELVSDHPMHHPFHVHGAGRFLILSRDGEPDMNLVWKDTVLVRSGQTVEILLEVTNPGRWMAHCHIAEHAESGMMFSFDVVDHAGSPREARS
jgi:FtsP/CotA-like multicopper oxidase with cupredoxin domain